MACSYLNPGNWLVDLLARHQGSEILLLDCGLLGTHLRWIPMLMCSRTCRTKQPQKWKRCSLSKGVLSGTRSAREEGKDQDEVAGKWPLGTTLAG